MRITEEDIRKFREIWREEFAEEIAAEEAREHITRLDTLYLLLARQAVQGEESAASRSEDIPHQ